MEATAPEPKRIALELDAGVGALVVAAGGATELAYFLERALVVARGFVRRAVRLRDVTGELEPRRRFVGRARRGEVMRELRRQQRLVLALLGFFLEDARDRGVDLRSIGNGDRRDHEL